MALIRKDSLEKLKKLRSKIGKDIGDITGKSYANGNIKNGLDKVTTYEDELKKSRKFTKKRLKMYSQFIKMNENKDSLKDIIITIPQSVDENTYLEELKKAENGEILNFKVANFPKTGKGNKCYIVYKGFIRGYMIISNLSEKEFTCTTTNKHYKGKFIERTGKFYKIDPIPMKGFQNFRYYSYN